MEVKVGLIESLATMNEDEYRALSSLVSAMAMEIRQLEEPKTSLKEARARAAQKVGERLTPPVTGPELESAIAKARSRLFRDKRLNGIRRANEAKKLAKTLPSPQEERSPLVIQTRGYHAEQDEKPKRETVTGLYREWVDENDTIPLDNPLAHFNSKTPEAFSFARATLIKEGYAFQKKNGMWHVMDRPGTKKFTEKDVNRIVADVLAKLGK